MILRPRPLAGLWEVISPPAYGDERGSLVRTFDAEVFREAGIEVSWVQQSISFTRARGVLRGLHLQLPPYWEAKLISVLSGRMFWAAVDIREGSPTFGRWDSVTLSPEGVSGLFAARGFAHGCLSLSSECQLVIDADNYYSREHGRGIRWNDPQLGIEWPLDGRAPVLSDEHRKYPSFKTFLCEREGMAV